jgi:hypothetical protein
MSRPVPEHGTTARYHRTCRCPACRQAHSRYSSEHRRQVKAGNHYTVPAAEGYRHLNRLLAAGHNVCGVSAAAGVKRQTVYVLATGRRKTLLRETSERILAVALDDVPASGAHLVPAETAHRLVEGMRSAGLARRDISRALGLQPKSRPVGNGRHVNTLSLRKIVVLYRLLAREGLVDGELLEAVGP